MWFIPADESRFPLINAASGGGTQGRKRARTPLIIPAAFVYCGRAACVLSHSHTLLLALALRTRTHTLSVRTLRSYPHSVAAPPTPNSANVSCLALALCFLYWCTQAMQTLRDAVQHLCVLFCGHRQLSPFSEFCKIKEDQERVLLKIWPSFFKGATQIYVTV